MKATAVKEAVVMVRVTLVKEAVLMVAQVGEMVAHSAEGGEGPKDPELAVVVVEVAAKVEVAAAKALAARAVALKVAGRTGKGVRQAAVPMAVARLEAEGVTQVYQLGRLAGSVAMEDWEAAGMAGED